MSDIARHGLLGGTPLDRRSLQADPSIRSASDVSFDHLANRRFPAGHFIREREQLDYLEEPDVFHDIFGHVPMLMNAVIADYIQAYGVGGLRAQCLSKLQNLARVYWYTVVIDDLDRLLELARIDFQPIYATVEGQPGYQPGDVLPSDLVLTRGTGRYHHEKRTH